MKQSWKWKAATAVVVTSMVLIAGCQQENQGTGISDTIGGSENGQADEDGRIPIEI
mgnify:CR=1 FL=1